MQENLFSILRRTVNVLIVDDLPQVTFLLREHLESFEIYRVHTASCSKEALDLIKTGKCRFHVCLMDLGLDDIEDNEFYLMDNFCNEIPFIVISGQEDTEKSFAAKNHGAMGYYRKDCSDFIRKVIAALNGQAIKNMIFPRNVESTNIPMTKCMESLLSDMPEQIRDLAIQANISDRQLRYEWEENFGFCPKYSLCICHVFSGLFTKIGELASSKGTPDHAWMEQCTQELMELTIYRRFLEYFLANRSSIRRIIDVMPSIPAHFKSSPCPTPSTK
jgi:DNA-binding NarL/FixJ family response regulator